MASSRMTAAAGSTLLAAIVAGGCGAGPTSPARAEFRFTHVPLELSVFSTNFSPILQMGYKAEARIQPYVQFETSGGSDLVRAPADATVTAVMQTQKVREWLRIEFTAGPYRFYLNGLDTATVVPGQRVKAGEQVGKRRRHSRGFEAVGLGLINTQRSGLFVNPARYPDDVRFADDPLQFYEESMRGILRGLITPANADPAVSYDVPGRLLGLWYLPTVPVALSLSDEYANDRLSFFYTYWDAGGGTLRVQWGGSGYAVEQGNPIGPDPRSVSVSSGLVRYEVPINEDGYLPRIFLLVQLTSDTSLRFEAFDAFYTPNPTAFTANARTYVR